MDGWRSEARAATTPEFDASTVRARVGSGSVPRMRTITIRTPLTTTPVCRWWGTEKWFLHSVPECARGGEFLCEVRRSNPQIGLHGTQLQIHQSTSSGFLKICDFLTFLLRSRTLALCMCLDIYTRWPEIGKGELRITVITAAVVARSWSKASAAHTLREALTPVNMTAIFNQIKQNNQIMQPSLHSTKNLCLMRVRTVFIAFGSSLLFLGMVLDSQFVSRSKSGKISNLEPSMAHAEQELNVVEFSQQFYGISPLTPGKQSKCWFHSQIAHKQDQEIFKRMGGFVGSCSGAPVKDAPNTSYVYSEAVVCNTAQRHQKQLLACTFWKLARQTGSI
jgi:hypothetical protein